MSRERTYALVRMISFSSVSSVYFPCMSSRICFTRSTLRTKAIQSQSDSYENHII
jgi:hypothetical protein